MMTAGLARWGLAAAVALMAVTGWALLEGCPA